jgi:hypothetical protein
MGHPPPSVLRRVTVSAEHLSVERRRIGGMAAMVHLELVLAAALLAAMLGPQQGGGADVWAEFAPAHGHALAAVCYG